MVIVITSVIICGLIIWDVIMDNDELFLTNIEFWAFVVAVYVSLSLRYHSRKTIFMLTRKYYRDDHFNPVYFFLLPVYPVALVMVIIWIKNLLNE